MTKKKLPPYTYLGCSVTKDRTPWCRSVCEPIDGKGQCGRDFPGHMEGRLQEAVKNYKLQQRAAEKKYGPIICPRCGHTMVSHIRLECLVSVCMSCSNVTEMELPHGPVRGPSSTLQRT
jgi:ribosomal protein L34E